MTTKKLIFEKIPEKIGNLNIKIDRLSAWIVAAFVLGCASCRRADARNQSSYLYQPVVAVSYFCESAGATQKIDSYSSTTIKNIYFNNNLETHYNRENNLISDSDLVYSINQLLQSKNYEEKLNFLKCLKRQSEIITTCRKPIFPRITPLKLKSPEKLRSNITVELVDNSIYSFSLLNEEEYRTISTILLRVYCIRILGSTLSTITKTNGYVDLSNFKFPDLKKNIIQKQQNQNKDTLVLQCFCAPLKNDYVVCCKQNSLNIPLGTVGYIDKILEYPNVECKFNKKDIFSYTTKQKEILISSTSNLKGTGLIVTKRFLSDINFFKFPNVTII